MLIAPGSKLQLTKGLLAEIILLAGRRPKILKKFLRNVKNPEEDQKATEKNN